MSGAAKFLLTWKRTHPGTQDLKDFTGRLLSEPAMFARIYWSDSHPDRSAAWFWSVSVDEQRIGSGNAADAHAAATAAEAAYKNWLFPKRGGKTPTLPI